MTRKDFGTPPTTPYEVVTLGVLNQTLPSYSLTVETAENYTIVLPSDPVDHTMFIVEVDAQARILVTVPDTVVLTEGLAYITLLPSGASGFFGFRYSATVDKWFLLSATNQNFGGGGGGGSGALPIIGEIPTGVLDGTNIAFTTEQAFQPGTTSVFRNGLREQLSVGYIENAPDEILFTTAPLPSDVIEVDYLLSS